MTSFVVGVLVLWLMMMVVPATSQTSLPARMDRTTLDLDLHTGASPRLTLYAISFFAAVAYHLANTSQKSQQWQKKLFLEAISFYLVSK